MSLANQLQHSRNQYSNYKNYVTNHPEIVFTIGQQMASRLRNTTRKFGDLAFYDVTGRIARTLIELSKEAGCANSPGWHSDHDHPTGNRKSGELLQRDDRQGSENAGRAGSISVSGKTTVVFGTN